MTRFWTALAVTFLAVFAVAGCNDYGNTFQFPTGAALTSISPSQLPAGSPTFVLTMNGSGFLAQTKVQWNTKTCPLSATSGTLTGNAVCTTTVTTDTNGNVLTVVATISASLITKPGLVSVNTLNPASGSNNGLSGTINFIVGNPANPIPTISSVSPTCATSGAALSLTVNGTNFLTGPATPPPTPPQVSTLVWTFGSTQLQLTPASTSNPPTNVTSTQITVTLPASDVVGNATVAVSNPPSLPVPTIAGSVGTGGGASSPMPVTVSSTCPVAAKAQAGAGSAAAAIAEETPAVSLDGRYVAYTALQNEHAQVFLRDTCEGASSDCQPHTSLLSMASDGDPAAGESHTPSMSSDGRYVAFSSNAPNLIESGPPGRQVYLRDTCARADTSCKPSTILVSTDSGGALVGAESILPSISSSGRFVAFLAITSSRTAEQPSAEKGSSPGTPNSGYRQVFVRDTCLGFRAPQLGPGDRFFTLNGTQVSGSTSCTPKTTRISLQSGDGSGTDANPAGPALGGQAKHVAVAGAKDSTLLVHSVPVDDSVFLAITSNQR